MERKNKIYKNKKINKLNTAIAVFGISALLSTPVFAKNLTEFANNKELLEQTISDCIKDPKYIEAITDENYLLSEYYRIGEIGLEEYYIRHQKLNTTVNWEILQKTATKEQLNTIAECKKKEHRLKTLTYSSAVLSGVSTGETIALSLKKVLDSKTKKQNPEEVDEYER